VLDDGFFDTLLRDAGDTFVVPASGPAAILRRVHCDDDERNGPGSALDARETDRSGGSGDLSDNSDDASDSGAPRAHTQRRTIPPAVRSPKVLAVAAAVLVLLLVAGGAVWLGNGTPRTTAGLKAGSAAPSLHRDAVAPKAAAPKAAESAPSTGSTAAVPSGSSAGAASNASNAPSTTNGTGFADAVGQPARIEQTGSLDLSVGRGALSATVDRLNALAVANGGFVANSQTHSGGAGGAPSGTVTLQVPVASFSAVLRQVQALGRVSQLTTNATDVTGQYVDLQSRITALEASRQQYLTIMTKANSIGDVLAVQAQLDSLQSQIEQLQGQLAVLGSETDYSRLTTAVRERGAPQHHAAAVAPSGLDRAWHDSVHGFVDGAEGLIRIAGPALFALLCLGAVLLGGQLFWRRLQRHNL
jgi:hypothetical protein